MQVNDFVRAANSTWGSRDIVISGEGGAQNVEVGRWGRCSIRKSSKDCNDRTLAAFRQAMEREYGVFGTNAFDSVLMNRVHTHCSLRAQDVKLVMSRINQLRTLGLHDELKRQLGVNPEFSHELRPGSRQVLFDRAMRLVGQLQDDTVPAENLLLPADEMDTLREVFNNMRLVPQRNELATVILHSLLRKESQLPPVERTLEFHIRDMDDEVAAIQEQRPLASTAPTGLSRLNGQDDVNARLITSMEDHFKRAKVVQGMRVGGLTNPVVLQKLKDKGVEPGFLVKNDWSSLDTASMMCRSFSDAALENLEELLRQVGADHKLRAKYRELGGNEHDLTADNGAANQAAKRFICEHRLELGLAAGRQLKESVAYAAEAIIRDRLRNHDQEAREILVRLTPGYSEDERNALIERMFSDAPDNRSLNMLDVVKQACFTSIRNEIMAEDSQVDYDTFRHFRQVSIIKLDYNERDKGIIGRTSSGGKFKLPERVNGKHNILFRTFRLTSADAASAGAVAEACANDLSHLLGIPTQELYLRESTYTDGHRKLMLEGRFAEGYSDFDRYLRDGRLVFEDGRRIENIGSYKVLFMVMGDRDAVGSRAQNKGCVGNKFFAIDPGHSLEGNRLKIDTDFSFTRPGIHGDGGFKNYTIFDDTPRAEKFRGVLMLRDLKASGNVERLFDDYGNTFNDDGSRLDKSIRERLGEMQQEFTEQSDEVLRIFDSQLQMYDGVKAIAEADGLTEAESTQLSEGAIELEANLEKLTSPEVRTTSEHGEVELRHLEVPPSSRHRWKGSIENGKMVFNLETPVGRREQDALVQRFADIVGAVPNVRVQRTPKGLQFSFPADVENMRRIFDTMSEERVREIRIPQPEA